MTNQRRRLLELALESLRKKKSELDIEIETVMREMRAPEKAYPAKARRRPRLSRAERLRRSASMKAYWESRRKEKRAEK